MEIGTQAVDRLLEVLAPALGAELDRVLEEARRTQEAEFQGRLDAAIRETKAEGRRMADLEITKAITEASANAAAEAAAAARQEVTDALEAQFRRQLDEAVREAVAANTAQLRAEYSAAQQHAETQWSAERQALDTALAEWRLFSEAESQLAASDSQAEVLARFLTLAGAFASAAALYVVKRDGLALWKSRGATVFPPIVSPETSDPEMYFRPVTVRGKPVAAIAAAPPFRRDALDFLAACLERSVTLLGLKLQRPLPQPASPQLAMAPQVSAEPDAKPAVPAAAAEAVKPAASTEAAKPARPIDEAMHAEARQAARLVISEIKLYCEPEVKAGRANGDLYRRLRSEIENGRQHYREQVAADVAASRDYFHEELVRVLAENDLACLGSDYPGAEVS